MSDIQFRLTDRATELRRDFDHMFAEPLHFDTTPTHDFLSIRLGTEDYAVRLSQIAGLFADKKITATPSKTTSLLGITGFRGAIMPVYNLHVLLGSSLSETPRWIVIASATAVALAFEAFNGHFRCSHTAILSYGSQDTHGPSEHVREFIRTDGVIRPIVDLPSILDTIATPFTGVKTDV